MPSGAWAKVKLPSASVVSVNVPPPCPPTCTVTSDEVAGVTPSACTTWPLIPPEPRRATSILVVVPSALRVPEAVPSRKPPCKPAFTTMWP